MIRHNMRLVVPLGIGLFVMLACGLTAALQREKAVAQSAPSCNILMIIDRSGSVGQDNNNVTRMKQQIGSVIDSLGSLKTIEGLSINLGMWGFSSVIAPSSTANYNTPFMAYSDTSNPVTKSTVNAMTITPQGGTNYEQGFGYNGFALNAQVANPDQNIKTLARGADVLVFMTDGVPNTPSTTGSTGDNNPTAIKAAKAAYDKLRVTSPGITGYTEAVMVGTENDSAALDYVINGYGNPSNIDSGARSTPTNPAPHIYYTSAGYTNLVDTILPVMRDRCEEKTGVTPGDSFSLSPEVTNTPGGSTDDGSASATFSYNVDSTIPSGLTSSSGWKIEKLVVPKGQSSNGLMFGDEGSCGYNGSNPNKSVMHCDGIAGCEQLTTYIGGTGGGRSCDNVASGTNVFGHGANSLDQYAGDALSATLDDTYPIGTKICFVLIVHKPTQKATPLDRASRASCLVIGKRPSVQIHGGDLRVGRSFMTDSVASTGDSEDVPPLARIDTSVSVKSDGKTYGSWVEYGAFAPGEIKGFGSMSGLAGGYPSVQPDGQQFWSKLTFANVQNQFGYFTDNNQGTIPDYASAILAGRDVVDDLTAVDDLELKSGDNRSGVYEKLQGDLTISDSTLGKNETVVVNVPNGVVTIAGNIAYDDGPYESIAEIPQLIIIAKTINIKPDVVNVDSWLIANNASDGNTTGGTITTCDDPATLTVNVCDQQLRINGPIIAHQLSLRRTGGADSEERRAESAETINLSGASYLWAQSEGQSSVRAQTTLTTELPPYF